MTRVRLLGLLLGAVLAACSGASQPGGRADRGIGGTGGAAGIADRGIGGTGIDTGIVGTITGFGSVIVNGLEIADDTLANVEIDGQSRPRDALRVGQLARVVARNDGNGLRASVIEVHHEVSGPIWRILPNGVLVVAGQRVRITPRTVGDDVKVGDWVEVSGLRNAFGAILASRIDRRSPGEVVVSGRLVQRWEHWFINGLPVEISGGSGLEGRRVTASGMLSGRLLVARTVVPSPLVRFIPGLRRLIVQAFVAAQGGRLRLGDGIDAMPGSRLGRVPSDAPVIINLITGTDGNLIATDLLSHGDGEGGNSSSGPAGAPASGAAASRGSAEAGAAATDPASAGRTSSASTSSPAASSPSGAGSSAASAAASGASAPGYCDGRCCSGWRRLRHGRIAWSFVVSRSSGGRRIRRWPRWRGERQRRRGCRRGWRSGQQREP